MDGLQPDLRELDRVRRDLEDDSLIIPPRLQLVIVEQAAEPAVPVVHEAVAELIVPSIDAPTEIPLELQIADAGKISPIDQEIREWADQRAAQNAQSSIAYNFDENYGVPAYELDKAFLDKGVAVSKEDSAKIEFVEAFNEQELRHQIEDKKVRTVKNVRDTVADYLRQYQAWWQTNEFVVDANREFADFVQKARSIGNITDQEFNDMRIDLKLYRARTIAYKQEAEEALKNIEGKNDAETVRERADILQYLGAIDYVQPLFQTLRDMTVDAGSEIKTLRGMIKDVTEANAQAKAQRFKDQQELIRQAQEIAQVGTPDPATRLDPPLTPTVKQKQSRRDLGALAMFRAVGLAITRTKAGLRKLGNNIAKHRVGLTAAVFSLALCGTPFSMTAKYPVAQPANNPHNATALKAVERAQHAAVKAGQFVQVQYSSFIESWSAAQKQATVTAAEAAASAVAVNVPPLPTEPVEPPIDPIVTQVQQVIDNGGAKVLGDQENDLIDSLAEEKWDRVVLRLSDIGYEYLNGKYKSLPEAYPYGIAMYQLAGQVMEAKGDQITLPRRLNTLVNNNTAWALAAK